LDVEPLDNGGLRGIRGWDQQSGSFLGGRLQRHRKNAFDGPRLAGQCQLADDREGARAVKGDLPTPRAVGSNIPGPKQFAGQIAAIYAVEMSHFMAFPPQRVWPDPWLRVRA
jgi:hypothetical protein